MSTQAPELELRLSVPKRIQQDRPFSVAFTVANVGSSGVYFKRPWKWASNGMYLQARGEDGLRIESETRLYDIATEDICTYFKPIAPGEEFTFHIEFGAADFGPTIRFSKPGRYHLKWIYDATHYEDEVSCADANWPIWQRRLESTDVSTVVE